MDEYLGNLKARAVVRTELQESSEVVILFYRTHDFNIELINLALTFVHQLLNESTLK